MQAPSNEPKEGGFSRALTTPWTARGRDLSDCIHARRATLQISRNLMQGSGTRQRGRGWGMCRVKPCVGPVPDLGSAPVFTVEEGRLREKRKGRQFPANLLPALFHGRIAWHPHVLAREKAQRTRRFQCFARITRTSSAKVCHPSQSEFLAGKALKITTIRLRELMVCTSLLRKQASINMALCGSL